MGRSYLVKETDLWPICQQVPIAQPFRKCGPSLFLHKSTVMYTLENKRGF
jgi:hypothetical protein